MMPGTDPNHAAKSFEELHTWQRGRELTNLVYAFTRKPEFAADQALADQMRRAAVSIISNIAEGFERGSKIEFIQFLFIAKGSCGELRAQARIARDQNYIAAPELEELIDKSRRVSAMLSNFIAHLQKTDYPGEKFARPGRQQADSAKKRIEALRRAQEVNIRARKQNPEPIKHD